MKHFLTSIFTLMAFLSIGQGCSITTSNLTEISGNDGSGNCTYTIDILFTEGQGPDNGTLTFSSPNANVTAGGGPHNCACSGNTYSITFEAACGSIVSFTAEHDNSGNGSDCSVSVNNVALSVEWLDFDIVEIGSSMVSISWSTAQEVNNDYFEIEYSRDGKNFEFIEKIEGAGNSNVKSDYEYQYKLENSGIYYYRIKQVDFDSKYSYSEIRYIDISNESRISMYPNPAHENLYISVKKKANFQVSLYNSSGIRVLESRKSELNLSQLPDGIYMVVIQTANKIESQKLIIKH